MNTLYSDLENKEPIIKGFEIKWLTFKINIDVKKIFKRHKRNHKKAKGEL